MFLYFLHKWIPLSFLQSLVWILSLFFAYHFLRPVHSCIFLRLSIKKGEHRFLSSVFSLFYKIISRKLAFRFISERMKYFMDPAFPVCSTSKAGFYLLIFLYGATAFTMIQIPIVMIISGKVLPRIISILISNR